MRVGFLCALLLSGALAACSDNGDRDLDKSADCCRRSRSTSAANCVDSFGDALTDSFGRIDGKLIAVVKPTDTQCPTFNNDHLLLEVEMNAAVYRVVVNVISDRAGELASAITRAMRRWRCPTARAGTPT